MLVLLTLQSVFVSEVNCRSPFDVESSKKKIKYSKMLSRVCMCLCALCVTAFVAERLLGATL